MAQRVEQDTEPEETTQERTTPKNYIIWNNHATYEIPNFIVCELPPITKPQLRTRTVEIDGRDGDIIEPLGYESYTKKVKIGITGSQEQINMMLPAIMKYFSGSGTLILSNEPDYYYKATITKKIDYNRLLRYRTATIEFHVQPFKYLVNEAMVETDPETGYVDVHTNGLEYSKPLMTITGTGEITISNNSHDIFTVSLNPDESETIIIDSEEQEAYDSNGNLANRKMSGDFLILEPYGEENHITWTGNLETMEIQRRSRWL